MHKLYNITLILSKKYIPKGQRDNLFRVYIHEVKKKESFLILDKEDIPPPRKSVIAKPDIINYSLDIVNRSPAHEEQGVRI